MSAVEIIEQIKKLPSEEQLKVAAFIHAAEDAGALEKPDTKITQKFKQASDAMFVKNAELFRKLAQ